MQRRAEPPSLELIESVRCLDCASIYPKPAKGGTVVANPGCPDCGYLGWIPASKPFTKPSEPRLGSAF